MCCQVYPSGCPTARSPAVRKGWNGRRLVPSRASRVRVQGLASVAACSYYCKQLLFAVYSGVELSVYTQLWWLQDVPFLSCWGGEPRRTPASHADVTPV